MNDRIIIGQVSDVRLVDPRVKTVYCFSTLGLVLIVIIFLLDSSISANIYSGGITNIGLGCRKDPRLHMRLVTFFQTIALLIRFWIIPLVD